MAGNSVAHRLEHCLWEVGERGPTVQDGAPKAILHALPLTQSPAGLEPGWEVHAQGCSMARLQASLVLPAPGLDNCDARALPPSLQGMAVAAPVREGWPNGVANSEGVVRTVLKGSKRPPTTIWFSSTM